VRFLVALAVVAALAAPARADRGHELYARLCLACHGATGDGRGPAASWLDVAPRDFTKATFKWRSTEVGAAPLDEDLAATVRHGVHGRDAMIMPAFPLEDADLAAVVAVVKGFGAPAKAAKARAIPARLDGDAARGAQLWKDSGCASCHGADGRGNPAAAAAYDLTTHPLRRPHAVGDERRALFASIATGLAGTAMPGYGSTLSDGELADLVAFVETFRWKGAGAWPGPIAAAAIARDEEQKVAIGRWPGDANDLEANVFGKAIAPQGEPPPDLSPAQASLSSRRCGRCHAKQHREWSGTIHNQAMSAGMRAQLSRMKKPSAIASCLRCHAPLAEQAWDAPDAELRNEAITCASCHVRGWVRHGPLAIHTPLDPLPSYPTQPLDLYGRSDLCLGCHQLPARHAVNGKPLLDTYREWLLGPYMPRGVQCQHCHMPAREHTWLGIHDPETFRQGIKVEAIAGRSASGAVSVRARLWNVGAGHMLPTTPTPAAWLEIDLVDARGDVIKGAHAEQRIGRKIRPSGGDFVEDEDTRVPPGGSIEVAGAWKSGRVAEATHARITVRVHPDDYYEALYRRRLAALLPGATRTLYEEALARGVANRYVAETLLVPIAGK
jgi:mono/diheme cytochrome c family protein